MSRVSVTRILTTLFWFAAPARLSASMFSLSIITRPLLMLRYYNVTVRTTLDTSVPLFEIGTLFFSLFLFFLSRKFTRIIEHFAFAAIYGLFSSRET